MHPPDIAPARGPRHGRDRGVGSYHPTLRVSRWQARQRSRTQDRAAWYHWFADLERPRAHRSETRAEDEMNGARDTDARLW